MSSQDKKQKSGRSSGNNEKDKTVRSSVMEKDKCEKTERGSVTLPREENCEVSPVRAGQASNDDAILNAVLGIQKAMQAQEEKLNKVVTRMDELENYDYEQYGENSLEFEEYEESEDNPHKKMDSSGNPPDKRARSRSPGDARGKKRTRSESPEVKNRFVEMKKRFKNVESCDVGVDELLANNINDLFSNGMEEKKFNDLVSDKKYTRPENCENLRVVKLNKLVWEAVSASARCNDKKMQNIENTVVKASIGLTKIVNSMANIEDEHPQFGELIDSCNDVLALLGHSNRQINLTRKDLLRPELKEEYTHLCNHSIPFTAELFGDDVSKSAKEIEDTLRVGNKIHRGRGRFPRSRFRGRFRGHMAFRGRGYPPTNMGPSTSTYGATPFGQAAKNWTRRGPSRPRIRTNSRFWGEYFPSRKYCKTFIKLEKSNIR